MSQGLHNVEWINADYKRDRGSKLISLSPPNKKALHRFSLLLLNFLASRTMSQKNSGFSWIAWSKEFYCSSATWAKTGDIWVISGIGATEILLPFVSRGDTDKTGIHGEGNPQKMLTGQGLDSRIPVSKSMRNEFLLFLNHCICGILSSQPGWRKTQI